MTASLYQVDASSPSNPILRYQGSGQADDVRRRVGRVQLDVVPAVGAPGVAAVVQDVVHPVRGMAGAGTHGYLDPAGLLPARVEVDDHDDRVTALVVALGVGEQLLVVGLQEAQRPVLLEHSVPATDAVEPGDERPEAAGPVQVPVPDL